MTLLVFSSEIVFTYVDGCVEVDAVVVAVEGVLRVRRAVVRDDRADLMTKVL